jgi:hypothetical protein
MYDFQEKKTEEKAEPLHTVYSNGMKRKKKRCKSFIRFSFSFSLLISSISFNDKAVLHGKSVGDDPSLLSAF